MWVGMYLTIEHNSGVSVSAQIVAQIKYMVVSGQLHGMAQFRMKSNTRMLEKNWKANND